MARILIFLGIFVGLVGSAAANERPTVPIHELERNGPGMMYGGMNVLSDAIAKQVGALSLDRMRVQFRSRKRTPADVPWGRTDPGIVRCASN